MGRKFECALSNEELDYYYNQLNYTIKELCEVVGCKSDITMAKILHQRGFDTDNNAKRALATRNGRTDEEFKNFLISEYIGKRKSMNALANELGISQIIVKRYLDKYGIPRRTKSEQQRGSGASNWKGGKRKKKEGYIEIYIPEHPKANKRGCVYEHVLVAEKMIGRHLNVDEVVHHIDRNRSNNTPSNLMVLTKEEHTRIHSEDMHIARKKKEVVCE